MIRFLALIVAIFVVGVRADAGGERLAVLELFTSHGCSACPPADALLAELAGRDDVLALSYHVDYWDHPGSVDPLSSADSTRRQRAYAALFGARAVYTPQMVVNGAEAVIGSRRSAVLDAVARSLSAPLPVAVALGRADGLAHVDLRGGAEIPPGARVVMIGYRRGGGLIVIRGETPARRRLSESSVLSVAAFGAVDRGAASFTAAWPEKADGIAVLVQAADGRVLGAARYEGGPAPAMVAVSLPPAAMPIHP